MEKHTIQCYDIKDGLRLNFNESPDIMGAKYGFQCIKSDNQTYVYTHPHEILLGKERFIGEFRYENDKFKSLELKPVTDIEDDWQSEEKTIAEKRICENVVSLIGNRTERFEIRIQKLRFRDASSHAYRYVIIIE